MANSKTLRKLAIRHAQDTGEGQFTGGLDVVKNLTPNLNASITVNTDSAETEADIRQVNLTRFPLFFPEKRTFFLEGAGVFDVAGLGGDTDLIPFFARRIGLHGDEDTGGEVPIGVGAKIVGRQSGYNIGLLDVAVTAGTMITTGIPFRDPNARFHAVLSDTSLTILFRAFSTRLCPFSWRVPLLY
jgi:hypothetical protein